MKSLFQSAINAVKVNTSVIFTEKTRRDDVVIDGSVIFKSKGDVYRLTFIRSDRSYVLEQGYLTDCVATDDKTGKMCIVHKFVPEVTLPVTAAVRQKYHATLLRAIS